MAIENVTELKSIKGYMMFTLVFVNERTEEVSLEISCSEDIETQMEMFIKQQWKELFEDSYDHFTFLYANFDGIKLVSEEQDYVSLQIYQNQATGQVKFEHDNLKDKNADKLKRIREIANE